MYASEHSSSQRSFEASIEHREGTHGRVIFETWSKDPFPKGEVDYLQDLLLEARHNAPNEASVLRDEPSGETFKSIGSATIMQLFV